jgi:hypothetical protein
LLKRRSYHHYLGNGIDAVLLGPSGGMTADAAHGLDRCYWYKSDLHYPDTRRFQPGDDTAAFLAAPPGGTNFQLAPLGRAWFEVFDDQGMALPLGDAEQRFSPHSGVLYSRAVFGGVPVEIRTYLAPDRPALLFDLRAPVDLTVRAKIAPGLWREDVEQFDPVANVARADQGIGFRYAVGAETCEIRLTPHAGDSGQAMAVTGGDAGRPVIAADFHGRGISWWVTLESSRYGDETDTWRRVPSCPDFDAPEPPPAVQVPDGDYQRLHTFSMYMFRAMQHRQSGGLPVNNLRRTFNSHVFWDGAFVQRALLEAGHVAPAREAWRFLARTRAAAAANARAVFDAPGLHWDWETTHRGERAYLPWLQQRFQVHNTPLLAKMVMDDFRASGDLAALAEGYELMAGAAVFLLHAVLVDRGGTLVTRPLVGSHESAKPVVNDGATVAACLSLLRSVALASRLLGRDRAFGKRCAAAAWRLAPTMASLFDGRYFQASTDEHRLNTSSLAPIYPADAIAPTDSRAVATAEAYRARYAGRMAGHGNSETGFPWSAGILARILAYQGQTIAAWEQLELTRPALCDQGGCAEYIDEEGRWNMQYFSTAQAALCSALHALLLQRHGSEVRLFDGRRLGWEDCAFSGFLTGGLRLDARYQSGKAMVLARNERAQAWRGALVLGKTHRLVSLRSGERLECTLEDRT